MLIFTQLVTTFLVWCTHLLSIVYPRKPLYM